MGRVPVQLRELVKHRLDAAAEEIFELLEKTLSEYEDNLISKYEQQRSQEALTTQVLPFSDVTHLAAIQTLSDTGQASEEPSEQPQIQIVNAQGAVKVEPLLENMEQTLVKEEPTVAVSDGSHGVTVKEEVHESKALSPLFIKEEQIEQSIAPLLVIGYNSEPSQGLEQVHNPELNQGHSPNQNEQFMNHNLDQIPDQKRDLDQNQTENKEPSSEQDFEEDNVEWEFEGLSPPRRSPDETENSSEDDEVFPQDHPPKLQRNCYLHRMGQTTDNDVQTNAGDAGDAGDADDGSTENSSDSSDSEATTPQSQRQHSLKEMGKAASDGTAETEQLKIDTNAFMKSLSIALTAFDRRKATAAPTRKPKNKGREKNKCAQSQNNSGAETNHECGICKRSFETLSQMKAHQKSHSESLPCPVCGKTFKKKHFMDKHMKSHQSKTQSQERTRKGQKRKRTQSEKTKEFKKRRVNQAEVNMDLERTDDSSDKR